MALLERDRELDAIGDALAAARVGDGRCILVEGPAGIGKTALLAAARVRAQAEGWRVLAGAGGELEAEYPYGVVRQLFEPTLADAADLLTGAAAFARAVLTLEEASPPLLDALHGLYWLTVNLTAAGPVLVAVDDAHWCDGASLRFLLYLRRRLDGLPVLLLVAARPGEPGGEEQLLGQLAADAVRPATLSEAAVAGLLQRALGAEPAAAFGAAAHAATGGSPFLVGELAKALADLGIRPTADATGTIDSIGPRGVQRDTLRRLAALGKGATAFARGIAVLGGGAELHHAAALAGVDDDAAARLAEALVRVQILSDERRLSFVHPLVRAAIYTDIPAAARAREHARAADVLARSGASADAVAAHLLECDPAARATVVEHLRTAASRAAARGAMDVAATYLRRALAEPTDEARRGAVLRELGAAELAAGQPDSAAERLAQAAALAEDQDAQVSIVLMRRHALVLADRIPEAVAIFEALETPPGDQRLPDLLDAGAIGAGQLDFSVAPAIADRIAALQARATALREPLALAVAASAKALGNGPFEECAALAERAIAALPHAHPASDYSVEGQLAVALLLSERFERLSELAAGWLAGARRAGSLPRFISMATVRSISSYRSGALADAESDARDALEAARLYGHQFWLPGAVAALISPLVEQGRFDEAEALLTDTRVQELHGDSRAFCWTALLLPARGRLRAAQGRLAEGLADLLACGEVHESAVNRSPSLWPWRSEAALALAALGERERGAALAADELRLARDFGAPRALGVALRAAGLVAGDVAVLEEAAATLASSGARLEHARALADLGSTLRRGGRRADARGPLREALELAVRCGAGALAARAREELAATGAHPRRERLTGPDALTPSELRVARMAAAGRSNPEIAQALFLTRRTVETHLTHAYQKLGIVSRDELAAALAG